MRKIIFLFIVGFAVVNLYSQPETDKRNTIVAHIGPGIGGAGAVGSMPRYLNVGIDYSRRFSERWSFCTGVEELGFLGIRSVGESTWNGDTLIANFKPKNGPHWEITSIPIQLKRHFGNIAYISFGSSLNIFHFKYSTEVGLGWSFSAGLEHEFNNNIMFSLNPYIGWSRILSQQKKGGDTGYLKAGIGLGIGYKF